jgi:UDP-N-acetylglucosamine 4,6-dehydratase
MKLSSNHRTFADPKFNLDGKNILITGGTGSFGTAFLKHIISRYTPNRVVIYSRDEFKQHQMGLEFPAADHPYLRFFIGDVRNYDRLEMAMRNVDYVVHAAAMKQVGAAEYNPLECVHTNILGAENVIRAAMHRGVEKVIALSTDKAANPVNLYGATKLASDKIFINGNYLSGADGTRFAVVRYGNVVGSRGSVVEVFAEMIAAGVDSLPITDDKMTRFWISLAQATSFVESCFALMAGGEVFIPKIPSLSVMDLAKAMAPELKTHIIGIRAGEKLHEIMVPKEDSRTTFDVGDRYIIESALDLPIAPLKERFGDTANLVDPEFEYASGSNEEWLNIEALQDLLREKNMLPDRKSS